MNEKHVERLREVYAKDPQMVYDNTLNTFVRGIEIAKIIYSEPDLQQLKNDILKTIDSIR